MPPVWDGQSFDSRELAEGHGKIKAFNSDNFGLWKNLNIYVRKTMRRFFLQKYENVEQYLTNLSKTKATKTKHKH